MLRRVSLTNLFNQIKSQRSDHGYQSLKSGENQEVIWNLSSSEKLSDDYKQSQNPEPIYHCPTRRILSEDWQENFEIVYEIHNGFTFEQVSIIENALQILVNKFFKPEILQNMYQICNISDCFLTNGTWSHSNLTNNPIYNEKYLLLEYQLMCLKTKSENREFPTINICPRHDKNERENENSSACISCISHGSTFCIDGEFEIELDQDQINGSSENSTNVLFWAGRIVYEMLRNLGHRSDQNSNFHQSQIDVFKKCFLYDGNYFPNKTQ